MQGPVGIGVVGMGNFALFAAQQFAQVEGVRPVSFAKTSDEGRIRAANRFGLEGPVALEDLLNDPEVTLVYVATPPALHFEEARQALLAGKDVLCEKPLSLTSAQATELVHIARERGLFCVANQMQVYNPLVAQVKAVIDRGLLGEPLYARFENLASDEALTEEHWFWKRDVSGGIFLEHGVHFFDLFAHWFGPGKVTCASRKLRQPAGLEEQVTCDATYGGVQAHFLHTFTQASRMDRQEFRLVFENGDIRMEEWVPTRLKLDALLDDTSCRGLMEVFPRALLDIPYMYGGKEAEVRSRHKERTVTQRVRLTVGEGVIKYEVYGALLRHLIADQLAWKADPAHNRILTEENGLRAVVMAEEATRLAEAEAPSGEVA